MTLTNSEMKPSRHEEEPIDRQSTHPGQCPATIQLVHFVGGFYRVVLVGIAAEQYSDEFLEVPEHCGCDGWLMPSGHRVYRALASRVAISAEHVEVIEWNVAVEVEEGNAYVWADDAMSPTGHGIRGIWRHAPLVDDREDGSAPWTRDLAAEALANAAATTVTCGCGDKCDSDAFVCLECEFEAPCDRCGHQASYKRLVDGYLVCYDCTGALLDPVTWGHGAITVAWMAGVAVVAGVAFHPGLGQDGVSLHGTITHGQLAIAAGVAIAGIVAHGVLDRVVAKWGRS